MKLSAAEIDSLLFAEQGADPAIPASGFGRLFVKADGVYFIDDAGTVTGPFTSSTPGAASVPSSFVRFATGSTSINTGNAWANLSTHVATATDRSVAAVAGDTIAVTLAGLWGNEAQTANLDAATIVGGSIVNVVSNGTGTPPSWVRPWQGTSGAWGSVGGSLLYTLQAGDISAGTVTVRARVRTSGAKTFYHEGGQFAVVNFGQ